MKIVLDTNVLISGLLAPTGMSYVVMDRALKKHILILSDYILDEFERVLIQKFDWPKPAIEKAQMIFKSRSVIANPPPANPPIDFKDPGDIPILHLVQWTKAHCLITGDKQLLQLKKFEGTIILSPREALERL